MPQYYEYPTNYSNGTAVDSASDFFLGYPAFITNALSSSSLAIFVFMAFFLIAMPFGVGAAITASGFITFILTTYLWWNGVLAISWPMAFLILTIVGAIATSGKR